MSPLLIDLQQRSALSSENNFSTWKLVPILPPLFSTYFIMSWNSQLCLGTISWGRLKISYLHLPSGPHLVAVFHEEFTEAGPVDHVRVEVRCLWHAV